MRWARGGPCGAALGGKPGSLDGDPRKLGKSAPRRVGRNRRLGLFLVCDRAYTTGEFVPRTPPMPDPYTAIQIVMMPRDTNPHGTH